MLSIFRQFEPTTAAKSTPLIETISYETILVSATKLTGLETVKLEIDLDGERNEVTDLAGNIINLNASRPSVGLLAGFNYVFTKSVTASPSTIYVVAQTK